MFSQTHLFCSNEIEHRQWRAATSYHFLDFSMNNLIGDK
ncbi:hypothetical protein F3Y22_tig00002054pilonHSYRG00001 [Hibiscus syriacus]|uniref:Uncharacterized protein n=1 Tax=Hibiscus syriacus TaxID=106335 RepID=A0A6A3CT63_HIBSY|nr:hypothetical protein F3Y22_tig00002054pilonHSYRG00001 [Hibiscus syriacus]